MAAIDAPALARTREAAAGMAQMGIGGVPFFVFDRRLALSGAQAEATFIDALRQASEPAAAR